MRRIFLIEARRPEIAVGGEVLPDPLADAVRHSVKRALLREIKPACSEWNIREVRTLAETYRALLGDEYSLLIQRVDDGLRKALNPKARRV